MEENVHIGVMGGMFDPVHKTHIALARAALYGGGITKLVFMPAHQSPMKDAPAASSDADRLEMLKIALSDFGADYEICEYEMRRSQTGYAIDTANFLEEKYPNAKISWIIGGDHISKLPHWRNARELFKKVGFICASRLCYKPDLSALPEGARIKFLEFAPTSTSSTEIRTLLGEGRLDLLKSVLDKRVLEFIIAHKLYNIKPK